MNKTGPLNNPVIGTEGLISWKNSNLVYLIFENILYM